MVTAKNSRNRSCARSSAAAISAGNASAGAGAGTNFRLREGALENLRQRELAATGKRLSEQLGKKFEPPRTGERIEGVIRSEEHTSELQSLMRISYAVFCLKQKK